jgi:hypothetical protein
VIVATLSQFKLLDQFLFGEVLYFTRLAINHENDGLQFANIALIHSFSPPDNNILQAYYMTLPLCHYTNTILVIKVNQIMSVVAMISYGDSLFAVEQPGLSHLTARDGM